MNALLIRQAQGRQELANAERSTNLPKTSARLSGKSKTYVLAGGPSSPAAECLQTKLPQQTASRQTGQHGARLLGKRRFGLLA